MLKLLLKLFRKNAACKPSLKCNVGRSANSHNSFKEAVYSADLGKMVPVMMVEDVDPIDRHFLLQNICQITYKERENSEQRSLFYKAAQLHQAIFPIIVKAFKTGVGNSVPPSIPVFRLHATVLVEDQKYHDAIGVCNFALKYNVHDGTKSGFEGRIKRIKKKM